MLPLELVQWAQRLLEPTAREIVRHPKKLPINYAGVQELNLEMDDLDFAYGLVLTLPMHVTVTPF